MERRLSFQLCAKSYNDDVPKLTIRSRVRENAGIPLSGECGYQLSAATSFDSPFCF